MEQQDQTANVLVELPQIKVFRIVNGQVSQVCEGTMRIGSISTQNVYFLNIADFYYTLQKQIPFTSIPFETQRTIIFPHIDQGFSAIVIPVAYEQNAELDTILKTTITFLTADQAKQNNQLKQNLDSHAPEIWTKPLVEESNLIHYIQKGGGLLKTGFSFLGSVVASGVNKGAEWLDTKVDKNDNPNQVSGETKSKFNNIKQTTKKSMDVAGYYLNKAFTPVADYTSQVINDVSAKIDNSDNQHLKKAKEVTKATVQSANTAFGGLSSGAKEVGGAISDNTTKLVSKKYGDDASNTFLGAKDGQQQQQQQQPQQQQGNNGNYPEL